MAFPRPMGFALWAISLGLIIALWRSGFKPNRITTRTITWLILGLLLGAGLSILENYQIFHSMLLNRSSSQGILTPVLYSTSLNLIYHLGFAPLNEEPLFRGFLWGYLRQFHWKESWILFLQAILFTSAHIYFASQFPLRFWVFIPLAGLLFGLLTWRSRSLTPAILAHGLVNGSIYLLIVILILQLFAG